MRTKRELWRVAVHEAAHWIFAEWAGNSNVDGVTIVPSRDGKFAGHCFVRLRVQSDSLFEMRAKIMILCAGRAAENVLTGVHRYIDATDFDHAYRIVGGFRSRHQNMVEPCFREAEEHIRGVLWVPILTAASLLYDAKTILKEDAREIWSCVQPADWPWFISPKHDPLRGRLA